MAIKNKKWINSLITWYNQYHRDLPWRHTSNPYHIWISEVMLQQTQVATVIPYYERFTSLFPSVVDLAHADDDQLMKAWEGLGYYSRARNLKKAANQILNQFNGKVPTTYSELLSLTGIGPYIGAAIASIAFGEPIPVVDGNVLRVFTRFWGIHTDIRQEALKENLRDKLMPYICTVDPNTFNQSIMELGATMCTPKQPNCHSCPIASHCYANKHSKQAILPIKSPAKKTPHYDIVIGIIANKKNKLLITRRSEKQMLGGLWEFPGGKIEINETHEQALLREIKEETGLHIFVNAHLITVKHAYSHFKITLHAYLCTFISGRVIANVFQWIDAHNLTDFAFPTANRKVIQALLKKK